MLALSDTFGNRAERAAAISASDARSFATLASRSGRWRKASLSASSTARAVRGGSGRSAAFATRSFVVGGKSIAASKVYIASCCAVSACARSYCACAVPRRAQCGIGAVQREIRASHVEDQLLVRRRECHVPGDRKLTCPLDRGCPATEIEQQIVYSE